MQKNDLNAVEITDSAKKDGNLLSEDKLSNRNLFMYAFGTLGRDFFVQSVQRISLVVLRVYEEPQHGAVFSNHNHHRACKNL